MIFNKLSKLHYFFKLASENQNFPLNFQNLKKYDISIYFCTVFRNFAIFGAPPPNASILINFCPNFFSKYARNLKKIEKIFIKVLKN